MATNICPVHWRRLITISPVAWSSDWVLAEISCSGSYFFPLVSVMSFLDFPNQLLKLFAFKRRLAATLKVMKTITYALRHVLVCWPSRKSLSYPIPTIPSTENHKQSKYYSKLKISTCESSNTYILYFMTLVGILSLHRKIKV